MLIKDTLDEERFNLHCEKWRDETAVMSSIQSMCMHPSYQAIIGMGPAALPFIFKELKEVGDHWFWAIQAITQANIPPEPMSYEKNRENYLNWGREHGYL